MGRKWITKNRYIVQQVLSCNNPLLISSKTNNILNVIKKIINVSNIMKITNSKC